MTADDLPPFPPEILEHYGASGYEAERLDAGFSRLERARTREILERVLPPPPATVFDVGGGPGDYACWLARLGYAAHLIDVVPLHVELARKAADAQPEAPLASAEVGDARRLDAPDACADAVLLMGPMYHLPERADRDRALAEARRLLVPGGLLAAASICRFASLFDGYDRDFVDDPVFEALMERDLAVGRHENPENKPEYFTTAFLHRPEDLKAEVETAGFVEVAVLAVEGFGWAVRDFEGRWADPAKREQLLRHLRRVETEPSILGMSPHLLAVGRTP